jgi:cell wall-associated NlpC family hydrolase
LPETPEGEYTGASAGRLGAFASRVGQGAAGMLGVTQLQATVSQLEQIVTAFGTSVKTLAATVGTYSQAVGSAKPGQQAPGPGGTKANVPGFSPAQAFNPGSNTAGGAGQSTLKIGPIGVSYPQKTYTRGGFSATLPSSGVGFGAMAGRMAAQFGQNQMSTMGIISSAVQQGTLAMGSGFSAAYAGSLLRNQTFVNNALAQSPADAYQMSQVLSYVGASPLFRGPGSSMAGRYGFGAAAAAGIANPALSGTQAAMFAQQLYSPQTSMMMMRMGLPSPLGMGTGGRQSTGQWAGGMFSSLFGHTPSARELQRSFGQGGYGDLQLNMIGGPQFAGAAEPVLRAYAQLYGRGISQSTADKWFSQAAQGNTAAGRAAQAQLSRFNIARSIPQDIKNLQAAKTGALAGMEPGFQAGVQDATGALSDFYNILEKVTHGPLGQLAGYGGGVAGIGGSLVSSAVGGLAFGGAARLFSGGGGAGATGMAGRIYGALAANASGMGAGDAAAAAVAPGAGLVAVAPLAGAALGAAFLTAVEGYLGFKAFGGHGKGAIAGGVATALAGPFAPLVAGAGALAHGGNPFSVKALSQAGHLFGSWGNTAGNVLSTVTHPLGSLVGQIGFAGGGVLPGYAPGQDTVPVLASPGEGILVPEAVRGLGGSRAIDAINQRFMGYRDGRSKGYAKGGVVVTGAQVADFARKQLGPSEYVPAYQGPHKWDCSGFTYYVYHHFGLQRSYETSETLFGDPKIKRIKSPVPGALVFERGDGTFPPPGHVGIYVGGGKMANAPGTGMNTVLSPISSVMGFGIPAKGFAAGGVSGTGTGGGPAATTPQSTFGIGAGGGGGGGLSGNEVDIVAGALSGVGLGVALNSSNAAPSGGGGKGGKGAGGTPAGGGGTSANASVKAAQAYARSRLAKYGWGASQMAPLLALWDRESGWNRHARNPTSGAYGIPQSLPASKMGKQANPPQSNAAAQIDWGLGYIKARYGSPAGAERHEQAIGWYAGGTAAARAGWAWTGERGPELIRMTGGEQIIPASQSAHLARTAAKGTSEVPVTTSAAGNATVTLNFTKGSVVLQTGSAADPNTPSKAARFFVDEVAKRLESERVIQMIAAGVK